MKAKELIKKKVPSSKSEDMKSDDDLVFMNRILCVLSWSEKHVVWFGLGLLTATPRFRLVG